ncbi:MAG: hypothetical protein KC776_04555 [Myxococcales bacterium]|nr:hypothetical protein [Myxococcales bacterium]
MSYRTIFFAFLLLGCSSSDPAADPGPSGGAAGASGNGGSATGGSGGTGGGAAGAPGGGGSAGTPGSGGTTNDVGMFVAQGHMGRTVRSCDDGKTWIDDTSDDSAARCFENGFDCDHNAAAANGIAFHQGAFYATFGWGEPGGIRKSTDGVSFTTVLTDTTFGGVAASADMVLGAARAPQASQDQGATWVQEPSLDIGNIWNIREAAYGEGRFVMVGNDGDNRVIAVSADGKTFDLPTIPAGCNISFYRSGGIAAGGGAIVISDGGAMACRSTDAGATWNTVDMGSDFGSLLINDGTRFMAYKNGALLSSGDGASWKETPTTPGNLALGAIAASDHGSYVGVRGGWDSWYEKQRFYRSDDGVIWEELPAGSYSGGHPIIHIAYGKVPASVCP